MIPASRAETKFILDIDTPEQDATALTELAHHKIKILHRYKTKNGWHMVTEPFDPKLVTVPVNKDGLVLLDY